MYKQSNYNYFVPYQGEKVIYYNATTRNSFIMSQIEHERACVLFDDPISFELGFPTVFQRFREWGFFVEEGIDEIAALRFKYNKEVLYCPEVHVILCMAQGVQTLEKLAATLKSHVDELVNAIHPPVLCLEWTGVKALDCYEDIIAPVSDYTKTVCKQYGIAFRQQMAIEMEMNETIHDKLHHDKGIPTYKATIRKIEKLCNDEQDFNVLLGVGFKAGEEQSQNAFINLFPAHESLMFKWIPKDYQTEKLVKARTSLCPDDWEADDDRWYQLKSPRLNQYTILNNGDVYTGKPRSTDLKPWGRLTNDGKIEWNELQRVQLLGRPWFETEKCRKCKHLFLFFPVCSRMNNDGNGTCCQELNLINPENIVIKEFEQKSE